MDLAEGPLRFTVGHGRHGIACEDTTFEEGVTPLGTFQVNAILSNDRFEMDPALVEQSGKSEEELRESLFTNMNSIDFKGDGETGEYGMVTSAWLLCRLRSSPSVSTPTTASSAGTASPFTAPMTSPGSARR